MHRFWSRYIQPVFDTMVPGRIMEVGADFGWNTGKILAWCREHGAHVHIIDPAPRPQLHDVLAGHESEYTYYPLKSLDAIGQIAPPDVVLLDGDHNWTTMYRELNLLFAHAVDVGAAPPVVLMHDVAWPYARRDMYYNPEDLDGSERHPYAYCGMLPGRDELTEEGMNGAMANALHEGGPRNGVLTAIEDFMASNEMAMELHKLPFFNGLGILIPEPRKTAALQGLVDSFFTPESLLDACRAIEEDAMRLRAILTQTEARLTERTDALLRARDLLAKQSTCAKPATDSPGTSGEAPGSARAKE